MTVIRSTYYLLAMLSQERLPAAVARRRQQAAFLKLFRHAYRNNSFYRKVYRAHGVELGDVRTIEDLDRLPIVDKSMIRAAAEEGHFWNGLEGLCPIQTSGSTGEPFEFYVNRRENQWRKAQYLRPYVSTGRRPRERVLRLCALPSSHSPWFHRLGLFKEYQISSSSAPEEQYQALLTLRPDSIQGHPSSLRLLAAYIRDQELTVPGLRMVYTDSELLSDTLRDFLREVYAADVLDIFGTFETDNIAYECPAHRGYHVATDSVIAEICRDTQNVAPGEEAELICTVLHNFTTPFIRYNLGDLARMAAASCECGRTSPLLEITSGRSIDLVLGADGKPRTSVTLIQRLNDVSPAAVAEYQIVQTAVDAFDILIVPTRRFNDSVAERLRQEILADYPKATVTVRSVQSIGKGPGGKHRPVISPLTTAKGHGH